MVAPFSYKQFKTLNFCEAKDTLLGPWFTFFRKKTIKTLKVTKYSLKFLVEKWNPMISVIPWDQFSDFGAQLGIN